MNGTTNQHDDKFVTEMNHEAQQRVLLTKELEDLAEFVGEHSCHLLANLLLIRASWDSSKDWTTSLNFALEQTCWNVEEQIQIYNLGAELYSYEQETRNVASAMALKALELDRTASSLFNYLYLAFPFLTEEENRQRILELESLASNDSLAYYQLAVMLERFSTRYNDINFRNKAMTCYSSALNFGLAEDHPELLASLEKALEKLKHQ